VGSTDLFNAFKAPLFLPHEVEPNLAWLSERAGHRTDARIPRVPQSTERNPDCFFEQVLGLRVSRYRMEPRDQLPVLIYRQLTECPQFLA